MNKPLDFWVKWSATLVSLLLVICNSYDIMPYDRWLGLLAAGLWLSLIHI